MKKCMKKLAAALLTAVMGVSMCACGGAGKSGTTESAGTEKDTSATTAQTEATVNDTAIETEETTEATTEAAVTATGGGFDDPLAELSSREFAVRMGNGINLGNTLEATDNSDLKSDYEVSHWEMLWGNPITTQEMIDDMKAAGLDSLRIPVAWTNAMDFMHGDYAIGESYLKRVKEVVDYAYNNDMFVIINDHWDKGWWGMFGSEDAAQRDAAMELYKSMWTQIADYFKDYDLHLIFEGGNEEIGDRLNDITPAINPKGATLSKDECYKKALEINQTFVDVVRASGGNNAARFLLIPGYGTDVTQTLDARWSMPIDPSGDKLLLSVHYYTPWSYCGSTGETTWGTKKNYEEMNTLLEGLNKYGEKYGVVIGECGVLPTSSGKLKPNWQLWMTNFFANCDKYGYVPMLWNTGDILNRNTHKWIDEELETFLKERSYENEIKLDAATIAATADKLIADGYDLAPETFSEQAKLAGEGKAIAWIMWDSQDWNIVYSVGDAYDPDSKTGGVEATDVEVTGEGTYTVALDFTKTEAKHSTSTAFSAIGISNAEVLFPGYVITIKKVLINGEEYKLHGRNYTSSDDGLCTRSNLYNEWVSEAPDDARTNGGGTMGCSPRVFDQKDLGDIETLEITFDYTPGEQGISKNDANSKN